MNIKLLVAVIVVLFGVRIGYCQTIDSLPMRSDSLIFLQKSQLLKGEMNNEAGKLLVEVARSFMGTPYVGKTLEGNKEEQLVVNLRELDCTTFIESCLSITLALKRDDGTFGSFKEELKKMRYRSGVLNGYDSRLHYFSDWIYDNQKKGIVKDVTKKLGGIPYKKTISFMSSHPGYYEALNNNEKMIESIRATEKEINKRSYYYIPKDKVGSIEPKLEAGMIIAITSGVDGLDIAHDGFVVKENGKVHLLHASSDGKRVMISEKSLSEYLAGNKKQTGIMVLKVR